MSWSFFPHGRILTTNMIINSLSRPGTRHILNNIENQDFVSWGENENFLTAVLADGVSSCVHSSKGAKTACEVLNRIFLRKGDFFLNSDVRFYKKEISKMILSYILQEIEKISKGNTGDIDGMKEYSSTIAGILYEKKSDKFLCFNVGDGMIVASNSDRGDYQVLLAPYQNEKGCCVTTTRGAENTAGLKIFHADNINSIIILSDGAWKKVFNDKNFSSLNNFIELDNYLEKSNCNDDYSYIAMTRKEFFNNV